MPIFQTLAVVLNIIGAILVAKSIGRAPDGHWVKDSGDKIHMAAIISPRWFDVGMTLLILGFVIEIITLWVK